MKKKLKVDLHVHTGEDQEDKLPYSACQILDKASQLGFDAIAITNHNNVLESKEVARYARKKEILLIPGMEATLSQKHVLIINPDFQTNPIGRSLDDLSKIKTEDNLVIAPHPFFPHSKSLNSLFFKYLAYFDAIEYSQFYHKWINCNEKAVRYAQQHQLPLLGTSDCHFLWGFGKTYSLIAADKNIASIIEAVKADKIEFRSSPLSAWEISRVLLKSLHMTLSCKFSKKY